MTRTDIKDPFPDSDLIFHWCCHDDEVPAAAADSPKGIRLRKYTHFWTLFASEGVRDSAMLMWDLSKLADVAIYCWDWSMSSTRYWREVLSLSFLQKEPPELRAALLPDKGGKRKELSLNLPKASSIEHFSSPLEAAKHCRSDMSVLLTPHYKTEPTIDFISGAVVWWQATNAKSIAW
ncbi:g3287 [Coccomyxa elongata]